MPRLYENTKNNFSSFEEFKEVAAKTLNEIYGRVRPLDVIDFSFDELKYKAVGYYNDEVIPAPQEPGAPLSEEAAAAEQAARDAEAKNLTLAEDEAADAALRIKALYAAKEPVSYEDLVLANNLGIVLPEEIAAQLAQGVKEGRFSYEAAYAAGLTDLDGVPTLEAAKNALKQGVVNTEVANQNAEAAKSEPSVKDLPYGVKEIDGVLISDKALEFAQEKGVDVKQIIGTGRDGVIKKSDVTDYIANNAPAKENANGNSDEQPNA